MLGRCFVLALMAVSLTAAGSVRYMENSVDEDMLLKQKKIFDLLMHISSEILPDTECYELARNYDIMANLDHYMNKEVVMDFVMHYKVGLLSNDAIFTYYNQQHREEMMLLYRLLYFAQDFETFYKTACWARMHVNSGMFVTALTTAVIYRDDCRYIRLPAIYEIYPNAFFDSKVVLDAYRIMLARGKTDISESIQTFDLHVDLEDMCISPMYTMENKLNYFTNDIGLNAYYYYFRMMFPFWMNTKEYNVPKELRGDLYYFVHQQLMARYHLERISNGLGEMEDCTWDRMNLPGFNLNILFFNGMFMPRRDWWNFVPMYKQKYLEYLKKLETRILEAIESGFVIDDMGRQVSLMSTDGLNILGNIIEGNFDSLNLNYYGSYDALARDILSMDINTIDKNTFVPSALQLFGTSMRDPAFYRLYNRIIQYFLRYKTLLNRYTMNELEFTGVRIEDVQVDKLVTYFDKKDFLVNNIVDVPTMKHGQAFNMKVWQYYLNYKPFTYRMAINSDQNTKAVMRIFLGPAIEGQHLDDYSYLLHYYSYFFMLDEFDLELHAGLNKIERLSTDSILFKGEYMNGDIFYSKILQALEGRESMAFDDRMWGFPDHLMLPKGTVDGMRFKLFFYIGKYEDGKMIELPILGKRMFYGRSLGFPLDRPMHPWLLSLDNVYMKDVLIYNLLDRNMMNDHKINRMMDYKTMMMNRGNMHMMMDRDHMGMKDMHLMDHHHMGSKDMHMMNHHQIGMNNIMDRDHMHMKGMHIMDDHHVGSKDMHIMDHHKMGLNDMHIMDHHHMGMNNMMDRDHLDSKDMHPMMSRDHMGIKDMHLMNHHHTDMKDMHMMRGNMDNTGKYYKNLWYKNSMDLGRDHHIRYDHDMRPNMNMMHI